MKTPFYQQIDFQDPLRILALFSAENGVILLESSSKSGRYSFIGIEPYEVLTDLPVLKKTDFKLNDLEIPFQGGAMGYMAYNSSVRMGLYDLVIAFDHLKKRAFVFAGDKSRLRALTQKISELKPLSELFNPTFSEISSNFTEQSYREAVKKVQDYILAGDIFEANISQCFTAELNFSAFDLYRRLRKINPAPFSAFLKWDDICLVSASPERFIKLSNRLVETRPIKGTKPRGKNPEEDLQLAQELLASEKDIAENIMIVDLLRNDLSKVCEPSSVEVPQLCGLESYATVHHLVSVVTGKLQDQYNAIDLLRATFPGGSITGAPKIRAMEIIDEIEPTPRGPYCGCIGYIGFNGDMDTSIAIRTYVIKNNKVSFQAGGAVVLDSDPLSEYEETLTKASALRRALCESIID